MACAAPVDRKPYVLSADSRRTTVLPTSSHSPRPPTPGSEHSSSRGRPKMRVEPLLPIGSKSANARASASPTRMHAIAALSSSELEAVASFVVCAGVGVLVTPVPFSDSLSGCSPFETAEMSEWTSTSFFAASSKHPARLSARAIATAIFCIILGAPIDALAAECLRNGRYRLTFHPFHTPAACVRFPPIADVQLRPCCRF